MVQCAARRSSVIWCSDATYGASRLTEATRAARRDCSSMHNSAHRHAVSHFGARLQTEDRHLVVSEMIRLAGLKFDKVVKRSPRLGASEHFLGEDTHNRLEGCVRDQAAADNVIDITA